MKKNQRKKYRAGTLVTIDSIDVLRNSFSHWLGCKVFKVSEDTVSTDKKRYVWVDSYSIGIRPEHIRLTTKKERELYKKERGTKIGYKWPRKK